MELDGDFMKRKMILWLLLGFLYIPSIYADKFAIGLKYFGVSIHPNGAINSRLMPLKLDDKGIFVLNLGITASIEYFPLDFLSIKVVQGLYFDCLEKFAGFSHIGLRGRFIKIGAFSVNGGVGPTFIYRRSWYEVPGYDDAFSFFNGTKDDEWQWRFIWYGGEIEFNNEINKSLEISVTFIPGYPDLMNFSFGLKYKFD
jgi:hypothetical protein